MNSFKRISAVILAICMLCSMVQAFAAGNTKDVEPVEHEVTIQYNGTYDYSKAYEVLELVNQHRAEENLPALKMDEDLMESAMQRAAESSVYYDHKRPNGSSIYTVFPSKFAYGYRGENLAMRQETASKVVEDWMNSQHHRDNIMSANYNTIGIGCFYQDGALSWAQLFTSNEATEPTTKLTTKEVTVTIKALPSYLNVYFSTEEVSEGHKYHMYNQNLMNLDKDGIIEFIGEHIHYTSSNRRVLRITDDGVIRNSYGGTVTLSAYIDDMLVHAEELTLEGDEHIYGDVNHDHQFTSTDVVMLARFLVGFNVEIDDISSDANEDDKITNSDVVLIGRSLVAD